MYMVGLFCSSMTFLFRRFCFGLTKCAALIVWGPHADKQEEEEEKNQKIFFDFRPFSINERLKQLSRPGIY